MGSSQGKCDPFGRYWHCVDLGEFGCGPVADRRISDQEVYFGTVRSMGGKGRIFKICQSSFCD